MRRGPSAIVVVLAAALAMSTHAATHAADRGGGAIDRTDPARIIAAPPRPLPLHPALAPAPEIRFAARGRTWTLAEFLTSTPTTGFLVLRADGGILIERYLLGRGKADRLPSFSIAKTVTAMLVGQAVAAGQIPNLDAPVTAHLPSLAGGAFGAVPIRHLLTMTSGVAFGQADRSPSGDAARLRQGSVHGSGPGGLATVEWITRRDAAPGTRFAYSSADTQVLGLVLAAATGQPLAALTARDIWGPMGAEANASWLVDAAGHEAAFCCLNAVLRDYGRLGLLLLNEGRALDRRQVLPAEWVRAMLRAQAPRPPGALGYGYQTWLSPDGQAAALIGAHGQRIVLDRGAGLVVVRTAAVPADTDAADDALTAAAIRAVIAAFR